MATRKTIFLTIPLHNSSHYKIYKVLKIPNIVGALNPCFFLKNNILLYEPKQQEWYFYWYIYMYVCIGVAKRGVWVNALSKRLFEI